MKSLSDQEIETLREELASYAHIAWSGWMEYLFSKSTFHLDGTATIPEERVDRWMHQMDTKYNDLPEDMKKSDRAEADRILAIAFDKRVSL